jgi:hypothetical protein
MNKFLFSSLLIFGLTFSAQAENWTFFSQESRNTHPDYAVALIAGSADLSQDNSSGDLYGVELSLVCPLVHASEHTIRQQISLTKFHKNSVDLYTLEANPHYLYQLESHTYFGIGPSLGLSKSSGTDDSIVGTIGMGASIKKDLTQELFLGAELRKVYATERDVDNVRVIVKVGYYFE